MNKDNRMKKMKKKIGNAMFPYFLLIPTFVGIIVFSLYPFVKTIISSFSVTDSYGAWLGWAGTKIWKLVLQDEATWRTVKITLLYAGLHMILNFFIAMFFALLSAKRSKAGKVYQMLYALPMAISSVASAQAWKFIFRNDYGLASSIVGENVAWLSNKDTAFWVVLIVMTWSHVSASYMFLLAGFRGVSNEVQEAAIVDGANGFTRAVKIMIPIASPQIFYVIFLNIITSYKAFSTINVLTQGGPGGSTKTLMYAVYQDAVDFGQYEIACVEAILLFVLVFVTSRVQFLFEKKFVHYE